jgi:hypothetical protein
MLRWFRWKYRMARGAIRGSDDYTELQRINAYYKRYYAHSREDRLSNAKIEMWSNVNSDPSVRNAERERRRKLFAEAPVENTIYGMVMEPIENLLEYDRSIRSVLEVGVYIGNVLDELARRHPDIEFAGIDLLKATAELNSDFSRSNFRVMTGYALDVLEHQEVFSDLVFFNGTATRFRVREIKRYLQAIAKRGRYVVISEPLLHLPGGHVIDPARLPLDRSVPTSLSSEEWPPQYVHNYKGLAESTGFKILHYRVYEPNIWKGTHRIEMIAKFAH